MSKSEMVRKVTQGRDYEAELSKANDDIAILRVADNAGGYNKIIAYKDGEIKRLRDAHQEIIELPNNPVKVSELYGLAVEISKKALEVK